VAVKLLSVARGLDVSSGASGVTAGAAIGTATGAAGVVT
jgi:hypothetical protein